MLLFKFSNTEINALMTKRAAEYLNYNLELEKKQPTTYEGKKNLKKKIKNNSMQAARLTFLAEHLSGCYHLLSEAEILEYELFPPNLMDDEME